MGQATYRKVIQLAFVVRDLDRAIELYSEKYGIGPWKISEISSKTVDDLYKHDNKTDFAYRVAMCDIGDLEWELVEPLDDRSIYSDFLKENGPGLHHVAFGVDDYDEAVDQLKGKGKAILSSGNWKGTRFVHFDTEDDLDFVIELFKFPDS
jgi:catechol 2,3-dioxygenase-like lactoylglutathione lyase family enzyme